MSSAIELSQSMQCIPKGPLMLLKTPFLAAVGFLPLFHLFSPEPGFPWRVARGDCSRR